MAKGFRAKPVGSILGCLGALLLVCLCGFAFLNFVEVVKYVGVPFMVIPNALGLIETVEEEEVIQVAGSNGSTRMLEIDRAGQFLIYLPAWQQSSLEETRVIISDEDGEIPVYLLERGTRPYDTTAVNGYPNYWFKVHRPGNYEVTIINAGEDSFEVLDIAIVPDYISGNEAVFNWTFVTQILVIVSIILAFLLFLRIRTRKLRIQAEQEQQRKRAEMDDFISELKRGN